MAAGLRPATDADVDKKQPEQAPIAVVVTRAARDTRSTGSELDGPETACSEYTVEKTLLASIGIFICCAAGEKAIPRSLVGSS
jgi:hypothetical protein